MRTSEEGILVWDNIKVTRLAIFTHVNGTLTLVNEVSPRHFTWVVERGYVNGDRVVCYHEGENVWSQTIPAGTDPLDPMLPALAEWFDRARAQNAADRIRSVAFIPLSVNI